MSAAVLPAEVAAIETPAWATAGLEWERDGDGGWTRSLMRDVGTSVYILQGQSWNPVDGLMVHERELCGLDSIQALGDGDGRTAADEARALAADLLEAAAVLDAADAQ